MLNTDINFNNSNSLYLRSMKMIELKLSFQSWMYTKLSKRSNQLKYKTMSTRLYYEETLKRRSDCEQVYELQASKTSHIIGSINKTLKDFNTKIHFKII